MVHLTTLSVPEIICRGTAEFLWNILFHWASQEIVFV